MKKYILIFTFLVLSFAENGFANELGKRYLKLGNTYRETKNFDKAEEYLNQAKKLLSYDVYWTAAANESLAYMQRDMVLSGNYANNAEYLLALAKENMENALSGYKKVVKQPDGSPIALSELSKNIDEINKVLETTYFPNTAKSPSFSNPNFANSKIINYDNAKLKAIPGDLPVNMENFSAANNRIKDFPALFSQFPKLQYINLKNNKINSLDAAISSLRAVKVLNLSENKIKTIPQGIAELKSLEVLDLSKNKIKQVPSSISALKNLKVLDISGNKIEFSQISTLIKNMPNTNIIFDRYERVDEEESEENMDLLSPAIQGR